MFIAVEPPTASEAGRPEADVVVRLFTTVFTPSTWAASLEAACRSISEPTAPLNVTTPLFAFTVMALVGTFESELILAWTSVATCASARAGAFSLLLHPTDKIRQSATTDTNNELLLRVFISAPYDELCEKS